MCEWVNVTCGVKHIEWYMQSISHLPFTSVDYLSRDTEIKISAPFYLRRCSSKVRPIPPSTIVWQRTKLVNLSEFVWEFETLWYSKQESPYDREIIPL